MPGRIDTLYRGQAVSRATTGWTRSATASRAPSTPSPTTPGCPRVASTRIIVIDSTAASPVARARHRRHALQRHRRSAQQLLGDSRANCTVRNNRLDEEDIDLDGQLNMTDATAAAAGTVQALRGGPGRSPHVDARRTVPALGARSTHRPIQRRAVLGAGAPQLAHAHRFRGRAERPPRARAAALAGLQRARSPDSAFTGTALARLRLVGAPWLKRTERPISRHGRRFRRRRSPAAT